MDEETRKIIQEGKWHFEVIFDKAVLGCLQLKNGWVLCSMRCCMNKESFDESIGRSLVKDDIVDQLVNLEAYKHNNNQGGWYKLPILDHEF